MIALPVFSSEDFAAANVASSIRGIKDSKTDAGRGDRIVILANPFFC
jgi:hypothetical protein